MARLRSRLRQRLRSVLTAAALLVCFVLAVLWIASLFRGHVISREMLIDVGDGSVYSSNEVVVGSVRGRLFLNVSDVGWPLLDNHPRAAAWSLEPLPRGYHVSRGDAPTPLTWVGIDWRKGPFFVTIPYWLPICAAGCAAWLMGRRIRLINRRIRSGQCPACGYDIRATPDRCPECGLAAATS